MSNVKDYILALYFSLLRIPIARFSFIFTCDTCSFECKCSSSSTPRYFTDLVRTSLLPLSLNLKLLSMFNFFDLNITSSVFFTFRLNLFAFNQLERLNRSLLIRLDNISREVLDNITLVSSAK